MYNGFWAFVKSYLYVFGLTKYSIKREKLYEKSFMQKLIFNNFLLVKIYCHKLWVNLVLIFFV